MPDFEKAQRMSLTTQVEVNLKSALIVGSLKPGIRLITREIAEQLGTSITPVREALLRLVSAGALQATHAQAFLVPEISLTRFKELNQIRKNLEGMAAAAAAEWTKACWIIYVSTCSPLRRRGPKAIWLKRCRPTARFIFASTIMRRCRP